MGRGLVTRLSGNCRTTTGSRTKGLLIDRIPLAVSLPKLDGQAPSPVELLLFMEASLAVGSFGRLQAPKRRRSPPKETPGRFLVHGLLALPLPLAVIVYRFASFGDCQGTGRVAHSTTSHVRLSGPKGAEDQRQIHSALLADLVRTSIFATAPQRLATRNRFGNRRRGRWPRTRGVPSGPSARLSPVPPAVFALVSLGTPSKT